VTPTDASVTPPKTTFFNTDPGNAADLGMLHIKSGDSGASVSSTSDELVIEGSSVGMSFLDATDGATRIAFGDSGDNDIGKIVYGHSSNQMEFVTNTATGLVIDSTGAVTKPLQPAFRVSNGTQNDVAINSNVTIIFSSEIYDKNSDFNTGTYTFTAPVTGRYLFAVTIVALNVDSAISYAQAKLVTSNHTTKIQTLESGADHFNEDAAYYQFHNTVIEEMDANDTAYVQIRIQGGAAQTDIDSDSNTGTLFHGYLLG